MRSEDGRHGCRIRSRAAGRFRWKRGGSGARRWRRTSTPVAWSILRCTLHHPRLLSGEARPLPSFALRDRALAAQARRMHMSRVAYRSRMQAITTVSVGRAVPRKSGGQSMLGRESVSVKRPCRFAGTQCGRDARAPRSARESPEGSSEPTRYQRKKPSPWGTKCLYPHSHPGISKTCGRRARLPEGASPMGAPHRPGRGRRPLSPGGCPDGAPPLLLEHPR